MKKLLILITIILGGGVLLFYVFKFIRGKSLVKVPGTNILVPKVSEPADAALVAEYPPHLTLQQQIAQNPLLFWETH